MYNVSPDNESALTTPFMFGFIAEEVPVKALSTATFDLVAPPITPKLPPTYNNPFFKMRAFTVLSEPGFHPVATPVEGCT